MILGDHVGADADGAYRTGAWSGRLSTRGWKYGLAVDNPVGDDGRFISGTPLFAGLSVWEVTRR